MHGSYAHDGYIQHPKFAIDPGHDIRAFLILQKDLQDLFDYIEPADRNNNCYSYRTQALLLRVCVEVEANCRAILTENAYRKPSDLTMTDYRKIEATHRLSSYEVEIPYWTGKKQVRRPFRAWARGGALPWYRANNSVKHDRHGSFQNANFGNLLDATCGLLVILSAQFYTEDFAPASLLVTGDRDLSSLETTGIGNFFRVRFPSDWPEAERYDFNWSAIKNQSDPFQRHDYTKVS